MDEKDYEDIAYVICAVIGIIAAKKLWDAKLKPMLSEHLTQLGLTTHQDFAGIALIALPLLIVLLVIRSKMKKAKRRREVRKEMEKRRELHSMAREFDEF
ncbi:hypothetical protein EVU97_14480 [Dermacoccus sp. 147Ba]|uniref:hypothetical protein n=1 Tax=Dermacoccus sp. 147Ba TaxID=2510111 RepID=UPI00101D4CE1|nr:hypothetical protein [Dermacoccus sp. 147Ba]RYI20435.1 hypothetical protein EVU97_14480 [Dermacoccus sp. 147Ba]